MEDKIENDAELDCIGLFCPMPIMKTKQMIDTLEVGQILKVEADDSVYERDLKVWAEKMGHEIVRFEKEGTMMTAYIRKK
jgi:TusA-related sulfurtransferase